MKDQMETSVLTSSFIYSHSRELLYIISAFALAVCALHFMSLYNFVIMIAAICGVAYLAWVTGYTTGVEVGVASTLESLIEMGYLETEAGENDTIVKKAEDLVYFDKCQNCEGGLNLNLSATKGHKNGEIKEEV